MPSSIQFLYSSGCSSVVVVVALPSLSPARTAAAAKAPAQTSKRNLRDVFIIGSTSIPEQRGYVRAVRLFVAASGPARSLRQEVGVIDIPDENMPRLFLLLEMALQAKSLVAFVEKSLI